MGWNAVQWSKQHIINDGVKSGLDFYHVHSYYCNPKLSSDVLCTTSYGFDVVTGIAKIMLLVSSFTLKKVSQLGFCCFKTLLSGVSHAKETCYSCFVLKEERMVKGKQFSDYRETGLPALAVRIYSAQDADELCFINIEPSEQALLNFLIFSQMPQRSALCLLQQVVMLLVSISLIFYFVPAQIRYL